MSTIIQNFRILTITNFLLKEASESFFFRKLLFLTEWRRFFTLATTPSNQRNQCYIGPLWPINYWNSYNRNHKCGAIKTVEFYLTSTYYWWLLRLMVTIGFYSKWKKTIRTALLICSTYYKGRYFSYLKVDLRLYQTPVMACCCLITINMCCPSQTHYKLLLKQHQFWFYKTYMYTVSQKNGPTLKRYSSKL